MDAGERLKVAGDAAVLIEEMGPGLTAVARLREGVVLLECWGATRRRPVIVQCVVAEDPGSAGALAERCVAELRAAMAGEGMG
jgi:hypothetical protein